MAEFGFELLIVGFYLGLFLVLAGVIVTVVGAVQRSKEAGRVAGWLLLVGAVLVLVTGTVIWNALADIGS
jgi:uncharacterized membrane protein YjjP (DUF1212 family)